MLISGDRNALMPCPCGSQKLLKQCCGVYLQGSRPAPTAETLMRSRYVAYCLKNIDYFFNTEHPNHRQPNTQQLIAATTNNLTWLGLNILATEAGQTEDKTGVVEFFAVYQEGNTVAQLHE